MANYIDNNILFEAYLHAENTPLTDIDTAKVTLSEYVASRAKFFLYPEVLVEIEFGDGSFKSWVKVLGAICLLIGEYPSFREGVNLIYSDILSFSNCVVSESQYLTSVKSCNLIRTESRTGIVGRLKRVLDFITRIRNGNGNVSGKDMCNMIGELSNDIKRLFDVVKSNEDRQFIKKELLKEINELPIKINSYNRRQPSKAEVEIYAYRLNTIHQLLSE